MKSNIVEHTLATKIRITIGDNLDCWHPEDDPEDANIVMNSAHLAAQGIARKMCLALAAAGAPPTRERWRQITQVACQGAFLELAADFPLLKIGENPDFIQAVTECTAHVVTAPGAAGSPGPEAREEADLRAQLQEFDIPERLTKQMIAAVRAPRE